MVGVKASTAEDLAVALAAAIVTGDSASAVTATVTGNGSYAVNGVADLSFATAIRAIARTNYQKLYGEGPTQASETDTWITKGPLLAKPGKDYQTALKELETHLEMRNFLVNMARPTVADVVVWCALRTNPSFARAVESAGFQKGQPAVARWYLHCKALEHFSTVEVVSAAAAPGAGKEGKKTKGGKGDAAAATAGSTVGGSDLERYAELPDAEMGKVVVRFPPEASGYLHIGHAKAALLNAMYARRYKGKLILRFDDTNPVKEKEEFENAILHDLKLLKITPDVHNHTSDVFDLLAELCTRMIKEGNAYVDNTDVDTMRQERMDGIDSKNRNLSVDENMRLWGEMQKGSDEGLSCCVRAKIDMQAKNKAMRDPVLYRCSLEPHVRTGTKYKAYPTYDLACPITDSIDGVTHALRTSEYNDRNDQYWWILDALGMRKPLIVDYARLNMVYTLLSKRKLTWFVENGVVTGWDDPRFPTVRGIRRRGLTVEGLTEFIVQQGASRSTVLMEWDKIWAVNKKVIDPTAPRYNAVLGRTVLNIVDAKAETVEVPLHKKFPEMGTKMMARGPNVLLEAEDAKDIMNGEEITLLDWGNVVVDKVEKDTDGTVSSLQAHLNLSGDVKKTKKKLHWVLADEANETPMILQEFDLLITKPKIEEGDEFLDYVNENSKHETPIIGERALGSVKEGTILQLQRRGFVIVDRAYNAKSKEPMVVILIPDGKTKGMSTLSTKVQPIGGRTKDKTIHAPPVKAENKNEAVQANGGAVDSDMEAKIAAQGNKVRELKAAKADPATIKAEVAKLLELKALAGVSTGGRESKKKGNKDQAAANGGAEKPKEIDFNSLSPEAKSVADAIAADAEKVKNLQISGGAQEEVMALVKEMNTKKDKFKQITGIAYKAPKKKKDNDANLTEEEKEKRKAEKEAIKKARMEAQKAAEKERKKEKKAQQKTVSKAASGAAGASGGETGNQDGIQNLKEGEFAEWYQEVLTKAEMLEYYDISGCYILRPWSYEMWEIVKTWFDARIKTIGVKNCYFPMFVSKAALEKEKDHIDDFSPEVAWVTHSGQSQMEVPIAIRPTSETVMYPVYSKWIRSHRDLPLLLNQWNNVVRWEFKHPQPFLRTREFLWQEGHTAHPTWQSAEAEVLVILDWYRGIYEQLMAVPVVPGRKTEKEKFAGGHHTTTVEAYIPASGRAIQGGTSHCLGENFSRMFDIRYADPTKAGQEDTMTYVVQNSWGITTRTIGVMVMVHGDNKGLVLPPRMASVQAVIIPCGITAAMSEEDKNKLLDKCHSLAKELAPVANNGNPAAVPKITRDYLRVITDTAEHVSPGWKFNHYEVKGVPVRLELGPRDLAANQVLAVRRDTGEKVALSMDGLADSLAELLETMQADMLARATKERDERVLVVETWPEFIKALERGCLCIVPWCRRTECEDDIKDSSKGADETPGAPSMGAKSLCIPFKQPKEITADSKCVKCGQKALVYCMFGRSY